MSLQLHCPCDDEPFICPYNAQSNGDCEYYCGEDEPEDEPEDWDYNEDMGFDPYTGGYTDDC